MTKVQIFTAIHGNEYMPTLAAAALGVSQIIGNPKALAVGKRFTDADLNNIFGLEGKGYEYERAKELIKILDKNTPIIDFHTFSAESDPFVIYVDKKMLPLAKKTGIKKLIFMKKSFKQGRALIEHLPGISVEVGVHNSPTSFDLTTKVIKNILSDEEMTRQHEIYEVFDIITKPGNYTNFSLYDNDFYPILAGKNPYDFYGLKAKLIVS